MTIPLHQRTQLQAAIEARQRLSRRDHDRGSRAGDIVTIVLFVAFVAGAYLVTAANDEHIADIENHQRTAQR